MIVLFGAQTLLRTFSGLPPCIAPQDLSSHGLLENFGFEALTHRWRESTIFLNSVGLFIKNCSVKLGPVLPETILISLSQFT